MPERPTAARSRSVRGRSSSRTWPRREVQRRRESHEAEVSRSSCSPKTTRYAQIRRSSNRYGSSSSPSVCCFDHRKGASERSEADRAARRSDLCDLGSGLVVRRRALQGYQLPRAEAARVWRAWGACRCGRRARRRSLADRSRHHLPGALSAGQQARSAAADIAGRSASLRTRGETARKGVDGSCMWTVSVGGCHCPAHATDRGLFRARAKPEDARRSREVLKRSTCHGCIVVGS